ncbi:MAG: hypothetical protein GC181_04595 [Bacteroidetes bacterium]|nr:hypothetical protein [Bacteroidota bacterium]
MMLLETADAHSQSFRIILIASEIIIPLIVFIGAYLIFKPVFDKQEKERLAKEEEQRKITEQERGEG